MPNMFIPFAERSSLISDIGKVVLDKVGKQLQEWKKLAMPMSEFL